MAYLVENERYKTSATWCNNASVACFVVGFVTPGVQLSRGLPTSMESGAILGVLLSMMGWFVAAAVLHWMARFALGRLRE
jgi:hypothetical protein